MKKIILNILIIIFTIILIVSLVMLGKYYLNSSKEAKHFESLGRNLEELHKRNPDTIAWLEIPGTRVNYPIMHTPNQEEFYLRKNFDKEYSLSGTPFMSAASSLDSDNIIIYGHNMKDGSMFHDLEKYKKEPFFIDHQIIKLETLEERRTYQIIATFKTQAIEGAFPYHNFINAEDETDFNDFIKQIKSRSFYNIDETANYGDKLLTLSTCEYSNDQGRMVVVAKRI